MKVKELRQALIGVADDTLVVVSRDGEGNSFSPLFNAEVGMKYDAANQEIGLSKLTLDLIEAGFDDEDVIHSGEDAIVLWPTG